MEAHSKIHPRVEENFDLRQKKGKISGDEEIGINRRNENNQAVVKQQPSYKNIQGVCSVYVKALFSSHLFAILCLCVLAACIRMIKLFCAPPFGAKIAYSVNASECAGPDFDASLIVCVCPRPTVCVHNNTELAFLVLSKLAANFAYPLYILLFLTKAHNLRSMLERTYLSELLPLDDLHQLHTIAGVLASVAGVFHSFWHFMRWGPNGGSSVWGSLTSVSGLIAFAITPLIVLPMAVPSLRRCLPFEWRKSAHYLSLMWGVALCFHAHLTLTLVLALSLSIYGADYLYGYFFKVHRLRTLQFTRLGTAVEIVWENPPDFVSSEGGYVYICLPWISKMEWHAFSLVVHPVLPNHSCVLVARVGDWTRALHAQLAKPSVRPGYVYGPFPSPFSTAFAFDNIIAVASGIGITPSISAIVKLRKTRRVNLIWMCREPDLVEFFLNKNNMDFDSDAWTFIFYTGSRKLDLKVKPANPMVRIFLGRPNISTLVESIVDNITNGCPMPSELLALARRAESSLFGQSPIRRFHISLERVMSNSYSIPELFRLALELSEKSEDGRVATEVSSKGFVKMIRTVCSGAERGDTPSGEDNAMGVGVTDAELTALFVELDTNCDGLLDVGEVGAIMQRLRVRMAAEHEAEAQEGVAETVQMAPLQKINSVVTAGGEERRQMVDSWQMLYCGGAAPVVEELRRVSKELGISLKVESFNW